MRFLLVLVLLFGIRLCMVAAKLPYYSDPSIKDQMDIGRRVDSLVKIGLPREKWKDKFYEIKDAIDTDKKRIEDLGSGLVIASLTVLLFLMYHKVSRLRDLLALQSISRPSLFLLANLSWLVLIPGTFWYYDFRGRRDDWCYWADSTGIPIFSNLFFGAILMVLMNIFIYAISKGTTLPTRIFIRAKQYSLKKVLWELFFACWLALNMLFSCRYIVDGDHYFIPVNLVMMYVLLVLRAGQISKASQTDVMNAPQIV